jgi:hypothetical protein
MATENTDKGTRDAAGMREHLLESVTLKSGPKGIANQLRFAPASVNLFVGPNHSGKSLLLREIGLAFQRPELAPHRKVLAEIAFTLTKRTARTRSTLGLETIADPSRCERHSYQSPLE